MKQEQANIHSYSSVLPTFISLLPHSNTEGAAGKVSAGPSDETKDLNI